MQEVLSSSVVLADCAGPRGHRSRPLREDPDRRLVDLSLRGEAAAFECLVRRHRAVAVRVAGRVVGCDEAEDVAQEALVRAYDHLGSFRGQAPFRSWLLKITHNAALNTLSRKRPLPIDFEFERSDRAAADGDGGDPVESLERSERRVQLCVELDALRPSYRRLLVLRDLEGHSYAEIASLLQVPIGSVKGSIHRARVEMIKRLRASTFEWELRADGG